MVYVKNHDELTKQGYRLKGIYHPTGYYDPGNDMWWSVHHGERGLEFLFPLLFPTKTQFKFNNKEIKIVEVIFNDGTPAPEFLAIYHKDPKLSGRK